MTRSLLEVLDEAAVLVTCGPGGVGKTTTAAALGLLAAQRGRRVVVVTVDPARRLADSLGIDPEANDPVPVAGLDASVGAAGGSLSALMLDASKTFDELVRREAGDGERAEAVLRNPVYRSISRALAGAQEYMAIERLHQLHSAGEHDLVIVDTPPSRHALDLLEAPDRLVSFLSHPVYRAVTAPTRAFARVTNAASSAFLWTVRKLAGPSIVEDTVSFFRSISGMEAGLRKRAAEVAALLHGPTAAFVVVASPRHEAADEAIFLLDALVAGRFPVGAVVVNLVHPVPPALSAAFDELELEPGPLADQLAFHRELAAIAVAERAEIEAVRARVPAAELVEIPLLAEDVHDVDGLGLVADHLGSTAAD
jgi:anion-transporting  ArsA/GET3 family ATPase